MGEWVKKVYFPRATGYDAALGRGDPLTPATAWMSLGDIVRSEIGQSQKDKYFMLPLS